MHLTSQIHHVFRPEANIEKRDEIMENISHFILQYKVEYGGKHEGAADEFTNFQLDIASDCVRDQLHKGRRISDTEFESLVLELNSEFLQANSTKLLV